MNIGVQMGTVLKVADNYGPFLVRCIQVLNKTGRCTGQVGDIIVVSVIEKRNAAPSDVKKGNVYRAVIVGTRGNLVRKDGSVYRVIDGDGKSTKTRRHKKKKREHCNRVVLVNNNNQPLGTRVFGPIPREIRNVSSSIISMAEEVL